MFPWWPPEPRGAYIPSCKQEWVQIGCHSLNRSGVFGANHPAVSEPVSFTKDDIAASDTAFCSALKSAATQAATLPCTNVTAPKTGGMGNCQASMAPGASCVPVCIHGDPLGGVNGSSWCINGVFLSRTCRILLTSSWLYRAWRTAALPRAVSC